MRLHKLSLTNFRGFASLELTLDPELTVLVGVNGAGKTSILDAIAKMLSSFVNPLWPLRHTQGATYRLGDLREGCVTSEVSLDLEVFAKAHTLILRSGAIRRDLSVNAKSDLSALDAITGEMEKSLSVGGSALPLAILLPTNRSVLEIPSRNRSDNSVDETSAYAGALEGGASNFRAFFDWFRDEEDLFNEQQVRTNRGNELFTEPEAGHSWIPVIRSAIEALFPGGKNLRVERRPQRMTIEVKGTRIDVAQLSDGEKCLLAMAGDIARRMVLAAPGGTNPLETEAVILIDEIELHLHPGLQRTILPRLRKAFPKVQLIVTTHSPQVLSSVHSKNVRLLEDFTLRPLTHATWHRDTNRILESAFGDAGRPPEVAEKLRLLRDAVDSDEVDVARGLIRELRAMVEGEDPDVFFLEQLLPPEQPEDGREVAE